jgi:putative Mn2+ efflux pump MntP
MTKPQREDVRELPHTVTMTWHDYFMNLFKTGLVCTAVGITLALIGVYTGLYYYLLVCFCALCVAQLWLAPLLILVIGAFIYVNRPRKQKQEVKDSRKSSPN